MTFLRHYNGCPRSGFFYAEHKGLASTMEMARGNAEHTILQRAVELMIAQGEPTLPPEIVKVIVNEVFAEQHVPFEEQDYVRESAFRWAEEVTIDPSKVIACETLIVLELAGWQVRCKIDFAETRDRTVLVRDYKSSRGAVPGYEELGRKRFDGTIRAKQFQLIVYALALVYGYPVRVETIEWNTGPEYIETIEPFPLASHADQFDLELVFPGIEDREGKMVRRSVLLTRLELAEYRESLIGLLKRVENSERTGDWPAIESDAACGECPARSLCPIPLGLKDHAGVINTLEEAVEACEVYERRDDRQKALRKEIKLFAKPSRQSIRFGKDREYRWVYSESDRIGDREGMFDAMQRAVEYGEPFERARFVKTVGAENFTAVTLTEDELVDEGRGNVDDG
jgi:PD-(D/E)XK nuclease superfamily